MSIFKAELKYYFRSPIIWLILALSAFVSAWSFLLSIDIFTAMQVKFSGMTDAPTTVQGIINPVISAQAKLLILVVSIIAGLSFSRLHHNNGWSLVNSYVDTELHFIAQKYLASLLVSLMFVVPSLLAIITLSIIINISFLPIIYAILGLLLLLMWMMALGMFLSSLVNNSGFAILLCLVVLLILWVISASSLDTSWGKNWIQVFSPQYHFQQFLTPYLSFSSLFYFIADILFLILAINYRLKHKRYKL